MRLSRRGTHPAHSYASRYGRKQNVLDFQRSSLGLPIDCSFPEHRLGIVPGGKLYTTPFPASFARVASNTMFPRVLLALALAWLVQAASQPLNRADFAARWGEDIDFMLKGLSARGMTIDFARGPSSRGQKDFEKLYPSNWSPKMDARPQLSRIVRYVNPAAPDVGCRHRAYCRSAASRA